MHDPCGRRRCGQQAFRALGVHAGQGTPLGGPQVRVAGQMIDARDPDHRGRQGGGIENRAAAILGVSRKATRVATVEHAHAAPCGNDRLDEMAANKAASTRNEIDGGHRISLEFDAMLMSRSFIALISINSAGVLVRNWRPIQCSDWAARVGRAGGLGQISNVPHRFGCQEVSAPSLPHHRSGAGRPREEHERRTHHRQDAQGVETHRRQFFARLREGSWAADKLQERRDEVPPAGAPKRRTEEDLQGEPRAHPGRPMRPCAML